jgi:hypothetical protein
MWGMSILLLLFVVVIEGGLMFGLKKLCESRRGPEPPGPQHTVFTSSACWRGLFNRVCHFSRKSSFRDQNSDILAQQKHAEQARIQVQRIMRECQKIRNHLPNIRQFVVSGKKGPSQPCSERTRSGGPVKGCVRQANDGNSIGRFRRRLRVGERLST